MAVKGGFLRAGTPAWVAPAYVAGLLLVFLGERVFPTINGVRLAFTGAGVVLAIALTALRWAAAGATSAEQRTVERSLALLSTGGLLALAVYFTTTDTAGRALGLDSAPVATRHAYESAATVAWVAIVLGTVVPMLFAERALLPMRRAMRAEWRRVREAMAAGLALALAGVYTALFTFVASELDVKADFSYFHTASPSESTRKVAASAPTPIDVRAFFPENNPVGVEVAGYLRELAKSVPNVRVELHDRLLVPELAKQEKVNEDGVIVLDRETEHDSLQLGTDINTARPKLKSLDSDFQKALLKVLRPRRVAYFTIGHGEIVDSLAPPLSQGRTGRGVRQIIESQNYTVHDLSGANGLGADIPEDASLVAVLGPQQPFLPEEVSTLQRYVAKGGHLLLALDPESKIPQQPLADLTGVRLSTSLLANDHAHLRRRYNDSDHGILVTTGFTSHASISTLSRMSSRPVIFVGAGSLTQKPDNDTSLHVIFAVHAMADTFNDENGNFLFDPPAEKRQMYGLAAAVSKGKGNGEMRAFVLSDADALSDVVLGNEANVILLADAVRWLGGDESFAGSVTTPEDVRIEHTKQKDLVWFYGTIFAAPALVLGLGLAYTGRIRRSKRKAPSQGKPPASSVGDRGVAT